MPDARASLPFTSAASLATPLLRPSQLARFWELHPKTLYVWIRDGRLPAVRTPGEQFRLRSADVRAFAESAGLPVPPFVLEPARRAVVAGQTGPWLRAMRRALKEAEVGLELHERTLDALFSAIAATPALLVIDASAGKGRSDLDEAVRALRRRAETASVPVVIVNAASTTKADALVRAGATSAYPQGRERDALAEVTRILG